MSSVFHRFFVISIFHDYFLFLKNPRCLPSSAGGKKVGFLFSLSTSIKFTPTLSSHSHIPPPHLCPRHFISLPSPPLPSTHLFSLPPSLPPLPSDWCRSRLRPGDAGLLTGPSVSAARWAPCPRTWTRSERSDMLTMNLEGLEMIAVLVVVVLFVKVLDRFGLLAASYDGKEASTPGRLFLGGSHLLLKLLTAASSTASGFLCSDFEMFNNSTLESAFGLAASKRGGILALQIVSTFIWNAWSPHESPAANWLRVTHAEQIR